MSLPLDVWAMMIFSVLAFFGVSIWTLLYTLRQEDQKMVILRSEDRLDTHSPAALRDLRDWIESNPDDPDVDSARTIYRECLDALQTTERHVYGWSDEEIESFDRL
ncbi:MAG: hypothetical protein ABEL97_08640 [Salinibacter sp.]